MKYRPRPLYLFKPEFLTDEISAAEDSFLGKWLSLHNPPDHLYHYTTLKGMQGILKNRSLWLGHVRCLNDPSEVQYGKKIMSRIMTAELERADNETVRVFLRHMLIHIHALASNSMHDPFVGCFCESDNLLSQWQGYADRGGGFNLGFEFSSATRIASNIKKLEEEKEPYLRKVIYDEKQQNELVQEYLRIVVTAAKEALNKGGLDEGTVAIVAVQAVSVFLDMLLCFKHPAFECENEWRMLRVLRNDVEPESLRFRSASGELIPYRPTHIYDEVETREPTLPLRSIRFGPMLEPERTRSTIRLMLQQIAADRHTITVNAHIPVLDAGYFLSRSNVRWKKGSEG